MKNTTLTLVLLCFAFIAMAQNGYEIRFKLKHLNNAKLTLQYQMDLKLIKDTNYTIENDEAVFRGNVPGPVMASVYNVKGSRYVSDALNIVLSNDKIEINGDASKLNLAKVSGGIDNSDFEATRLAMAELTIKSAALSRKLSALPTEMDSISEKRVTPGGDSLVAGIKDLGERQAKLMAGYVNDHPLSFLAYYQLFNNSRSKKSDHKLLAETYKKFNGLYKNSPYTMFIEQRIATNTVADANSPGKDAIVSFSKKDIGGKMINLDDLKGKYVVMDFWGSWCVPCRRSHPHLKQLYEQYKDKGLEMISVAYEKSGSIKLDEAKWKKAVMQDGLTWIQMLNEEDKEKFDAVKAYGIQAFPTHLLLDKTGKIIMREEGDTGELEKKLKEVLGND